jgi:lysozyme family protein
MKENYNKCLETILHHEGGYVNHPEDPGGETNLGVTKRVYEEHGGTKDMKDLTVEDVAPIYKKGYWDRMKCDEIPNGLDLCLFDFGTTVDGGIGPQTLNALQQKIGGDDDYGISDIIKEYQSARQEYYEGLSTFATFGKGWTRRVEETTELAIKLL